MSRERHEQNRRSWNAATRAHNSHKADQAKFLREGGSTLFPEELDLLGDLSAKSLLHLQCNAGQDSLSLAAEGAVVTGVDISDEAIEFAKRLAIDSGIDARFDRTDVYKWLNEARESGSRFDRVFSSYGAIPWLSDLRSWAQGIAGVLVDGGAFVLVEFHPIGMMFDEQWKHRYPYSTGGESTAAGEGVMDYVALSGDGLTPSGFEPGETEFVNPHGSHEFFWSVEEVVESVTAAGLRLEHLATYPFSNGARMWERMREGPGRRFFPPDDLPSIPLMFGLRARKAG